MNILKELDENTLKEEMKAFLNHKLTGHSIVKKMMAAPIIESSVEEFVESLKTKYPCSDPKTIKKGEDYVQSDSGGEQRVQELQTFVGSIGRIFEGYKRRYTELKR